VRFRHWRLYGEQGLAHKTAAVWLYKEALTVEFNDQPLSQYAVEYESDRRHLRAITDHRKFETQFRSPQLPLWELGDSEWFRVLRVAPAAPKQIRATMAVQLTFLV